MANDTDILHEAKRLRLLAAALELQHYTSTAANVEPIPGGDRVIVVGTPAEVRGLLELAPMGEASISVLDALDSVTGRDIDVGKSPVSATFNPECKVKRERLSLEQFWAIHAHAPTWAKNAMMLGLVTSQRRDDIANMRFADYKDGFLHVAQEKSVGETKLQNDDLRGGWKTIKAK
jgi:hypothetical protein